MNLFRVIFGICAFALVYVASQPGGFEKTYWIMGYSKTEAGEIVGEPGIMRVASWFEDRSDLNDTFNTSYLSDKRYISVEISRPFTDLLASDEEIPDSALNKVYAAARTPQILAELCADIIVSFAVECDLARPRTNLQKDGRVDMMGNLRFVPADAVGEVSQVDTAEFIPIPAVLTPHGPVDFNAEERRMIFERARLMCSALRNLTGNCAVQKISLVPVPNAGNSNAQPRISADAHLAVYADPAVHDKDKIARALVAVTTLVGL